MELDLGRQLCPAVTVTTSSAKLTGPLQPIFSKEGKEMCGWLKEFQVIQLRLLTE